MTDWLEILQEFGADHNGLFSLEVDTPDLLPYATLVNARREGTSILDVVGAVYEWQEAPLIFLVDGARVDNDTTIHKLRRLLAMRGDAPYLGIVAPGRLDVYAIALDGKTPEQVRLSFKQSELTARDAFPELANRRPQAARTKQGWISNVILNLLTEAIDSLIGIDLPHGDAISLVGRALFARFLGDRDLLPAKLGAPAMSHNLFDNAVNAAATCSWLDQTFNGDLLPLSDGVFERLPDHAYHVLGNIMHRAQGNQLYLGWHERWDQLDFAHIPVGVLSQAYELYLRSHTPAKQRKEGGYYTPRPIADLLVRASFRALDRTGETAKARILDPAAGAGVFLITAFRELVAARWRSEGTRPSTACLRDILYTQITGFDVNEEALRFAALALYLISIELDPKPQPVDKLRFEDLRGKVLHLVGSDNDTTGAKLGSLGPLVDERHRGRYDVVIGNPPWSSGTKLPDWSLVLEKVSQIASERAGVQLKPLLPNEVLDLPFVWRAMEWAKPHGQIAFALHARLLFQQGDGMPEARVALFQALDVTSVINGVELRQTKVWPEITAPFCLLIATNQVPNSGSGFRLVSPRIENALNASGTMRIDVSAAEIIATQRMVETPEILKVLFRGTKADLGLLERIRAKGLPTLESFWRDAVGVSDRGGMAGSGRGYQTVKPSSRLRKRNSDGKPGADAHYLHGLPDVTVACLDDLTIDTNQLDLFLHDRLHDSRDKRMFDAPITIVHKSPPAETGRIRVAVSDVRVAYSENFYGYSPGKSSNSQLLSRYLALVLGSKFTLWMALITSGEFGFEREVIEKAALDRIPIPDFRSFTPAELSVIEQLFNDVQTSERTWDDVDQWVAELYGLGHADLQTISDTLAYNLPFSEIKILAQSRPATKMAQEFCALLKDELEPWTNRFSVALSVQNLVVRHTSPWCGLVIHHQDVPLDDKTKHDWEGLLAIADSTAATEIILESAEGALLVGRLAQNRYWSKTQARLLAQHIIWTKLGFLTGTGRK